MIESWPPLTSPDGSSNRNPPERCPCPLYSWDSAQEDQEIPQRDQDGNYVNIKEEAEDLYEQSDDPCRKEDVPPEISTDLGDSQRDVKAEKEEERHVRIKEEEVLVEISTDEE